MDKITTNEVLVKKVCHNFYCDHCKKFLGTRIETDDGYYREPDGSSVRICMPFDVSKQFIGLLCDDCMKEFEDKINTAIITIINDYGLKEDE